MILNVCSFFSVGKKNCLDPKVIELDDKSDTEDDLDYIPPSPVPDENSYTTSANETRSAF